MNRKMSLNDEIESQQMAGRRVPESSAEWQPIAMPNNRNSLGEGAGWFLAPDDSSVPFN